LDSDRAVQLHELAQDRAPAFADAVTTAATSSLNEREFQTRVGELLAGFAKEVGVDLLFHEEYTRDWSRGRSL
jgi:hypothetical protein